MKLYKIEKGVKIPAATHAGSSGAASAIAATMQIMKRGECFLVREPHHAIKASKVMRDFSARERKSKGKRAFVSRKLDIGVRIWRVK